MMRQFLLMSCISACLRKSFDFLFYISLQGHCIMFSQALRVESVVPPSKALCKFVS